MGLILDARGNEFKGLLDIIGGETFTDARAATFLLGALNAEVIMDLHGTSQVVVDARTAAFNGTLIFEATLDNVNYFTLPAYDASLEQYIVNPTTTTTLSKQYSIAVAGFRRFRVRVLAYTSGNITIAMRGTASELAVLKPLPSIFAVTNTAAAATAVTLTLPAAGAGLFHYITGIEIMRTATAALAGTAALVVTTTNLPGALAWTFGNAMAIGATQKDLDRVFPNPLKSSAANTATTIVAPAPGAGVIWRINAYYYVAA